MKKKTLVILLIIPFIIGLLSFVSVVLLNISVATNISGIKTPYNPDGQWFKKTTDKPYLLEATPIIEDPYAILREGNNLVWEIEDADEFKDVAYITNTDDDFYLNPVGDGNINLLCHTENRGVQIRIKTIISDGSIIITPKLKGTGEEVEEMRYFGMYDPIYDEVIVDGLEKRKAQIELNVSVKSDELNYNDINFSKTEFSDNLSVTGNIITIENYGDGIGTITFYADYLSATYTFNIVNNGVNVYNYNDLLMCTNFSSTGEKVVMQTSLGSLSQIYEGENIPIDNSVGEEQGASKYKVDLPLTKKDPTANIELFGNYDENSDSFNFNNELYMTETTYNHKFLDDWNKANPGKKVSTQIKVGIRVQKDFYGNGFSINMNNLCFPNNGSFDKIHAKLVPSEKDYFFGPLAYVTIGEPSNDVIIVKAFGQDNAGMLIDGDNIVVNGINIQNIIDNSNRRNFAYIGTVIDVQGRNNTIKNSIISLGKTLIRAFDADGLIIDNCLLQRSGEFNLKIGSNQYVSVDEEQNIDFEIEGESFIGNFKNFFSKENYKNGLTANNILEQYLGLGDFVDGGSSLNLSKDSLNEALLKVQDILNNKNDIVNGDEVNYVQEITINDTSFADSGIFSIALETLFNGPYLYNGSSSSVSSVISMDILKSPLPSNIGGTSMPTKLVLKGNTEFYDWKPIDNIDISNLIEENIAGFFKKLGVTGEFSTSIDSFFPVKPILRSLAKNNNYVYIDEKEHLENLLTAIAYYGGGLNLSTVIYEDDVDKLNNLGEELVVDLLKESANYILPSGNDLVDLLNNVLSRCVLFAAGFEPFRFVTNGEIGDETPPLFGQVPNVNVLRENLKK